jgi:hypothetical protein
MRRLMLVAMIAALLPLGAVRADGPSLADAAAKEKERRAKAAAPAKVVTEGDLKSNGGATGAFSTAPTTSGSPDPNAKPGEGKPGDPAAEGKEKEKSADEISAEQQKAWRESLDTAQKNVQTIQASINDLQLRLNDLTQPMYGGGRAAQLQQMEDMKKQLADAQQKVTELQEQGRRSNYR